MPSPGLQSFVGSWYSVVAYGASGSGNTNDTTAIQAAMTAANGNGGGTVVVPAGTYRLDSSLSWTGLTNVCLWLGTGASFTGVGTVTAASGTNNSIFDQRTSGGGGTVTSVTGTSPISVATGTTTPAITFDTSVALSQNNTITGTAVGASGLTGAANAVRIVGRNASGAPTTGTFQVGDVVINTDGTEYVCTVAGTPGTWVALNPGYGTPVNIDASVTSLSAGSLTSVARADHVHTLSNLMVLIASVTTTSATASYTLSNIPQTYKGIFIYAATKGVNTPNHTSAVSAQFNGDTGSNYYSMNTASFRTDAYLGLCSLTGNYLNANAFFFGYISDYASTTNKKMTYAISTYNGSTSTNALNNAAYANYWNNTAAITSIKLFITDGYNFDVGSHIRVYGMP